MYLYLEYSGCMYWICNGCLKRLYNSIHFREYMQSIDKVHIVNWKGYSHRKSRKIPYVWKNRERIAMYRNMTYLRTEEYEIAHVYVLYYTVQWTSTSTSIRRHGDCLRIRILNKLHGDLDEDSDREHYADPYKKICGSAPLMIGIKM